jgi:hypothetical protein
MRDGVLERLGRLARDERRHPKDTAALLLERAIDELAPEQSETEAHRTASSANDGDDGPA